MSRHCTPPPSNPGGRTLLAIALLTVMLAAPRFAHTTPDSAYYIAMADFFKGEVVREYLATPFVWRWLVPWLAARLSLLSSANAIALLSLGATIVAYGIFWRLLTHLVATRAAVRSGLFVVIVSFPTINYGAAVLTDAAAFLMVTAAACAMIERRFLRLGLLLAFGAGVRETTLLMMPAMGLYYALQHDRRGLIAAGIVSVAALACMAAARGYFADLPGYHWEISQHRLLENLTRPVSWATVVLALVPVGPLAALGIVHWRSLPRQTQHFIIAVGLPGLALLLYSTLTAFMSGRFVWPLYLALVPLAALGVTVTWPVLHAPEPVAEDPVRRQGPGTLSKNQIDNSTGKPLP